MFSSWDRRSRASAAWLLAGYSARKRWYALTALRYIFISHDLSVVRFLSDRLLIMQKGRIVESGDADEIYENPQQEYTKQLINSIPKMEKPHAL